MSVGARSRWAGVLAGLWMLVIVLLVPTLVGQVPMTVLAALMILAGLSALDLREAHSIWATGGVARWSILVTFVATLVLSVPVAVVVGATLIEVLDSYADDLAEVDGRLYLSGVDERLEAQLRRARKLDLDRAVRLVPALDVLGASTQQAIEQASAWLGSARGEDRPATTLPDG